MSMIWRIMIKWLETDHLSSAYFKRYGSKGFRGLCCALLLLLRGALVKQAPLYETCIGPTLVVRTKVDDNNNILTCRLHSCLQSWKITFMLLIVWIIITLEIQCATATLKCSPFFQSTDIKIIRWKKRSSAIVTNRHFSWTKCQSLSHRVM